MRPPSLAARRSCGVANPFISAEFLLERLDQIGDKKGIDLSIGVQGSSPRASVPARHRRYSAAREACGPILLRATRILPCALLSFETGSFRWEIVKVRAMEIARSAALF
jgi:hypothetical protein